jgi:hypothetical protein
MEIGSMDAVSFIKELRALKVKKAEVFIMRAIDLIRSLEKLHLEDFKKLTARPEKAFSYFENNKIALTTTLSLTYHIFRKYLALQDKSLDKTDALYACFLIAVNIIYSDMESANEHENKVYSPARLCNLNYALMLGFTQEEIIKLNADEEKLVIALHGDFGLFTWRDKHWPIERIVEPQVILTDELARSREDAIKNFRKTFDLSILAGAHQKLAKKIIPLLSLINQLKTTNQPRKANELNKLITNFMNQSNHYLASQQTRVKEGQEIDLEAFEAFQPVQTAFFAQAKAILEKPEPEIRPIHLGTARAF